MDARDNDGNTPLHAAALNKPAKAGVIQSLLTHGGHFDLVNNDKRTFFDVLKGTRLHEITNGNEAVHSRQPGLSVSESGQETWSSD